jgi:hypothetical protein
MTNHEPPAGPDATTKQGADAAARRARRARVAQMPGMDELFPDVHKSIEEVHAEYARGAMKMWIWVGAFVLLAVAGIAMQALWMLALVALGGAAFAWDSANERRSTYKRMLLESKIEKSILDHEAKAAAARAEDARS